MNPAALRAQLEHYYHEKTSPQVQIEDFMPISDGWETEVYSFTQVLYPRTSSRILRMYPGTETDAVRKSTHEYEALLTLRRAGGYPVPAVQRHEADAVWLGKPFIIMQKIEGRPLGEVMRDDVARQSEWLTRFIQLFVDLHGINVRKLAMSGEIDSTNWLRALLARWRTALLDRLGQAWAAPVLDWLDTHRVEEAPALSPLHGDFHPHNILLTPDDQLYVIDWSGFQVGDYRYDLAWTLLLIATQGYPELRPIILSEYARLSGHSVDAIEYFDVLAALRRLTDFAVSVGSGAEAMGMRPETVALMRERGDHYGQVYTLLCERTGLRLPEIEQLLQSLRE